VSHLYFALMEIEQIAKIVSYATDSGLLNELRLVPATARQVALHRNGDERAYRSLLETLRGMGYLECLGDQYAATQQHEELRRDNSFRWEAIPDFLQTGRPWIAIDDSPVALDKFYTEFFESVGYANQMVATAEALVSRIGGTPAHILDVGAGTGLWSLSMARRLPHSGVVAVDFPNVLKSHFYPRAEYLGCRERVTAIEGDFHEVDFPKASFDRVVMGSSFHFLREGAAAAYVAKVRAALLPCGEFVVIDHFADAKPHQRLSRTLYEMRLAMRTLAAKNYSRQEIIRICSTAGFILKDSFEVEGPGFLSVLVFEVPVNV
jgi:ubiquinone/menaquinone biosynthesis C-methylase UbiE